MKRPCVLALVLSALFLQLQVQSANAESACVAYQFRPQGYPLSATFMATPPNCRSVKHSASADSIDWQGKHISTDSFTAELSIAESTATQIMAVIKPKGWTVGAEETLNDRERMGTTMLNLLLPGEKSHPWKLLSHYVRITVDGLPGVELAGTVNVDGVGTGGDRQRLVLAYLVVDQRRNQSYVAVYHLDAPGAGVTRMGFTLAEQGFRFLDSFHVDR
jgi:hypothetical protein